LNKARYCGLASTQAAPVAYLTLGKPLLWPVGAMTQPDDEYAMQIHDSYASQDCGRDPYNRRDLHLENPMTQVTTKIPPRYDGRTSWFAYEEAVDNWVDVTGLPKEKHGPV